MKRWHIMQSKMPSIMPTLCSKVICFALLLSCFIIRSSSEFRIGRYFLTDANETSRPADHSLHGIVGLIDFCGVGADKALILRKYEASIGRGLTVLARAFPTGINTFEHMFQLSHDLNNCGGDSMDVGNRETLKHLSLSLHPINVLTIKNLGYELENYGFHGESESLYLDCINLTQDMGCMIHFIFTCPAYPLSIAQSLATFAKMYYKFTLLHVHLHSRKSINPYGLNDAKLADIIHEVDKSDLSYYLATHNMPFYSNHLPSLLASMGSRITIREWPKTVQYLGYSPHMSVGLIVATYDLLFNLDLSPSTININNNNSQISSTSSGDNSKRNANSKRKLCIVSEQDGNSSPPIFLSSVIMEIVASHSDKFDILFFSRPNSILKFTGDMFKYAVPKGHKVVFIDHRNLPGSASVILDARCDILLYLALPTEKFTTLMSLAKLAKTTVQFGIGHPITSGSPYVDYSVVSGMFFDSSTSRLLSNGKFLQEDSLDIREYDSLYDNKYYSKVMWCAFTVGKQYSKCLETYNSSDHRGLSFCLQKTCPKSCFHSLENYSDSDVDLLHSDHTTNNGSISSLWDSSDAVDNPSWHLSEYYSEQLVVFNTLGYHMIDSLDLIAKKIDPLLSSYIRTCSDLEYNFKKWKLETTIDINNFGCFSFVENDIISNSTYMETIDAMVISLDDNLRLSNKIGSPLPYSSLYFKKRVHVYSVFQHLQKWHPKFDNIVIELLIRDKMSVFIVPLKAKLRIIPRVWNICQEIMSHLEKFSSKTDPSLTYEDFISRFIFVSRLNHDQYLLLLASIADVFLVTSPFSTGVTSSDAISLGIPVLVLKGSCQGIDIALGQTKKLAEDCDKNEIHDACPAPTLDINDKAYPYSTLIESLHAITLSDLTAKAQFWATTALLEIRLFDLKKAAVHLMGNHNRKSRSNDDNDDDSDNEIVAGRMDSSIFYKTDRCSVPLFSRSTLLNRKGRLFSEEAMNKTTMEWVRFLEKI